LKTVAKKKLYEGMFLVDSALAGADWDGVIAAIRTMLGRAEAEIVSMRKWDDRRLAYGINGKTRGTYILCYFRADGEKIGDIEKAVQLSEQIMRVLILSTERQGAEDIEKDTPATKMGKEKQKANKEATQKAVAEQVGTGEEVEKAKEAEQVEETEDAGEKEVEDSQESELSVVVDDSIDKQPEQDEIEDSESRNAGNGQGR